MSNKYITALQNSSGVAETLLSELSETNVKEALLPAYYNLMRDFKKELFGESLFVDLLAASGNISEEEEEIAKDYIDSINLATFAYNIYKGFEYQTCLKSFFVYVVPHTTYTTEEIELYLGLKLAFLRQKLQSSSQPELECSKFIEKIFPQDVDLLRLNPDSNQNNIIISQHKMLYERLANSTQEEIIQNVPLEDVKSNLKQYIEYRLNDERQASLEDSEEVSVTAQKVPEDVENISAEPEEPPAGTEDSPVEETEPPATTEQVLSDVQNLLPSSSPAKSPPIDAIPPPIPSPLPVLSPSWFSDEEYELDDDASNAKSVNIEDDGASVEDVDLNDEEVVVHKIGDAFENDYPEDPYLVDSEEHNLDAVHTSNLEVASDSNLPRRKKRSIMLPQPNSRILTAEDTGFDEVINIENAQDISHRRRKLPAVPKKSSKAPKKSSKRRFWTEEEVQYLEKRLLEERENRSWARFCEEDGTLLGDRDGQQVKDKAVGEYKRRRKNNLPLGGFKYTYLDRNE